LTWGAVRKIFKEFKNGVIVNKKKNIRCPMPRKERRRRLKKLEGRRGGERRAIHSITET